MHAWWLDFCISRYNLIHYSISTSQILDRDTESKLCIHHEKEVYKRLKSVISMEHIGIF